MRLIHRVLVAALGIPIAVGSACTDDARLANTLTEVEMSPMTVQAPQNVQFAGSGVTIPFASSTGWEVFDADPGGGGAVSSLGFAQTVCLHPAAPVPCPGGATVYNPTGPVGVNWTADLSAILGAHWIWAPGIRGGTSPSYPAEFFFSKVFNLAGPPLDGRVSVAVDDFAEVLVNGVSAGTYGSLTNFGVALAAQRTLTTFDITSYLVPGVNVITVRSENGDFGCRAEAYFCNPAGVVFGGAISFDDSFAGCANVNQIPMFDCRALVALYNSTDGPAVRGTGWLNSTDWLATNTPCQWYGVSCAGGRVAGLNLDDNNLFGPLPPEIGDLTGVTLMDLSDNHLIGRVPPEIGNMTSLTGFDLGANLLSGRIPPEIGKLINLAGFNFGNNLLDGLIPPEIADIGHFGVDVIGIGLDANRLSGPIPANFGRFVNILEFEILLNKDLTGIVPLDVAKVGARLPGNVPLVGNPPDPLPRAENCTFKRTDLVVPKLPDYEGLGGLAPSPNDICGLRLVPDGLAVITANLKAVWELNRWGALSHPDRVILVASLRITQEKAGAGRIDEAITELGAFVTKVNTVVAGGGLHPAYAQTLVEGANAAAALLDEFRDGFTVTRLSVDATSVTYRADWPASQAPYAWDARPLRSQDSPKQFGEASTNSVTFTLALQPYSYQARFQVWEKLAGGGYAKLGEVYLSVP